MGRRMHAAHALRFLSNAIRIPREFLKLKIEKFEKRKTKKTLDRRRKIEYDVSCVKRKRK